MDKPGVMGTNRVYVDNSTGFDVCHMSANVWIGGSISAWFASKTYPCSFSGQAQRLGSRTSRVFCQFLRFVRLAQSGGEFTSY